GVVAELLPQRLQRTRTGDPRGGALAAEPGDGCRGRGDLVEGPQPRLGDEGADGRLVLREPPQLLVEFLEHTCAPLEVAAVGGAVVVRRPRDAAPSPGRLPHLAQARRFRSRLTRELL